MTRFSEETFVQNIVKIILKHKITHTRNIELNKKSVKLYIIIILEYEDYRTMIKGSVRQIGICRFFNGLFQWYRHNCNNINVWNLIEKRVGKIYWVRCIDYDIIEGFCSVIVRNIFWCTLKTKFQSYIKKNPSYEIAILFIMLRMEFLKEIFFEIC